MSAVLSFEDHRLNKFLPVVCATLLTVGVSVGAGRTLYKWVDNQGITHYGDRVPPEFAGQEQHLMNTQGVEVGRVDAQRTPEQQALEDQKRQAVEDRAARDKNLLTTYSTVAEIERLRDQRLLLIHDQIKVRSDFLDSSNGRLKKLQANAERFRPYNTDPKAPPMSDQAAEDLVRLSNDIRTQQQNLTELRGEETTMKKQFESDISRFKELKHLQ